MDKIKQKLVEIDKKYDNYSPIGENDLQHAGLSGITLRDYQIVGVNWLLSRHLRNHGCILADEMGLGKTCQSVSFLLYLSKAQSGNLLILSPLSVLGNWQNELSRFAPSLDVVVYIGDKGVRENIRSQHKRTHSKSRVFLTTYEICLKDEAWLRKFEWQTLIVDEAHRLKNRQSLLHQTLLDFNIKFHVLLTGTPVQNNLKELYALLCFVSPRIFRERYQEEFLETFKDINTKNDASDLHTMLKPFLLRRLKDEVVKDLPKKSEIVIFHGITALQKRYYKAILTKDISVFENENQTGRTKLLNILMQLRKCVIHPYLFDGVEPEPFELGKHLVEASGKLVLLDKMLEHLHARGHKVLLFSQMTHMLDILQDYMGYRGYSYERLDGSVRGEERFLAVKNFNDDQGTFLFLLSTKAGGVGLNLVGADTVIFVDSDFNPQNDLQAAARAHRIGQTRPVKIFRLIGQSTVEEIILRRAEAKLKLTENVIEGGQFSHNPQDLITDKNLKLTELLKFGVESLLADDTDTQIDIDLEAILGASKNGEWVVEDQNLEKPVDDEPKPSTSSTDTPEVGESMYVFEGMDYSKATAEEPSNADIEAFDKLILEEAKASGDSKAQGTSSKNSTATASLPQRKAKTPLTEEEKAKLQKRRAELAAERQRKAEEAKQKRKEQMQKRKEALWEKNGYKTLNIALPEESDEESNEASGDKRRISVSTETQDDGGSNQINYVSGDVTQPQINTGSAIVVHCVDDSGGWGSGGLFSALDRRSKAPGDHYTLAGEMKDLALGDAHLIPLEKKKVDVNTPDIPPKATPSTSRDDSDKKSPNATKSQHNDGEEGQVDVYVALLITQHRDRKGQLSGILLNHLTSALKRVAAVAKKINASVHLPRIGYSTPAFNWYGTERLIRKHLAADGIPTYIYYFPRRRHKRSHKHSESESDDQTQRRKRKYSKHRHLSESTDDEHNTKKKQTKKRRSKHKESDDSDGSMNASKSPKQTQKRKKYQKYMSDSEDTEDEISSALTAKKTQNNKPTNKKKNDKLPHEDSDTDEMEVTPSKRVSRRHNTSLERKHSKTHAISDSE